MPLDKILKDLNLSNDILDALTNREGTFGKAVVDDGKVGKRGAG